ncbi:MAG: prephenate dehydratase [Candidatus Saccharimonadales bacterium]
MADRIAIQGYKGSFHDIAVNKLYGNKPKQVVYCKTIIDVLESLENGLADYALTAIGNNRYGDVNHVYDILINNHLSQQHGRYYIVGEIYQNVSHCLLAIKNTKISDIRTIYSQAPAIVQCFGFIHARLRNAIAVEQDDTALSAKLVSELKTPTAAAIASKDAAKEFGLEIIAEDIQDDVNNISRFILISLQKPLSYKNATKTSLLLSTSHKTGDLTKALDLLYENDINLSYLQSIPIPNRPFEYRFYLDIDAGLEDQRTVSFLSSLGKLGDEYEMFGSYKKATIPKLKNPQKRVKSW